MCMATLSVFLDWYIFKRFTSHHPLHVLFDEVLEKRALKNYLVLASTCAAAALIKTDTLF